MKRKSSVLAIVDELEASFFQFGDWLNSAMVIVAMILSYRADRVLHALYEDACEVGRLTDTSARLVEAATICGAVIDVEPEPQAGIRIKRAIDDTADRIAKAIQYRDLNAVDASLRKVPRLSIWEDRIHHLKVIQICD